MRWFVILLAIAGGLAWSGCQPAAAPAPAPSATTTRSVPTPSPAQPTRSLPTATAPPTPIPSRTRTFSPSNTPSPLLITHGPRTRPEVALTFDACQSSTRPAGFDAAIVRVLTETHTPATMFLSGLWVQSHPTETQLLASVPYFELGNHSWSHPDFAVISLAQMAGEITRTQAIIRRVAGRESTLFRFPFGTYRDEALPLIASHGLRTIQWDVVSGDPDPNVSATAMTREVLRQTQNGSIVIMHVNSRGWHTAEALPAIIAGLRERGFALVTVSRLLRE